MKFLRIFISLILVLSGAITATQSASAVTKTLQTIDFSLPSAMNFPSASTQPLSASATSNLRVAFTSLNTGICSVANGASPSVTARAAGTCSIRANQVGNTTYLAAPAVTQTFSITARGNQIVTWTATPTIYITKSPKLPSSPATSSGPGAGAITYAKLTSTSNCSVNPSTGAMTYSMTVANIGKTCVVRANAAQTSTRNSGTTLITFTISKTQQLINFPLPSDMLVGDIDQPITRTINSSLALTTTNNSLSICSIVNSKVHAIAAGTCSITVSQAGNTLYDSVTETRDFTIGVPVTITLAPIPGVTAPVTGATAVTTITETAQYTGALTWSPAPASTFAVATAYTATITITPKRGYTLTGVLANFFTVAGSTEANSADSGVVTALFPATLHMCGEFGLRINGETDPCQIGDVGPGGGIIFLLPSSLYNTTGKYFEFARTNAGSGKYGLCSETTAVGTSWSVGAGKNNTDLLLGNNLCSTPNYPASAASAASQFTSNGFHDWYLPSGEELVQAKLNLITSVAAAAALGINISDSAKYFGDYDYLASSEYSSNSSAWIDFGAYTQATPSLYNCGNTWIDPPVSGWPRCSDYKNGAHFVRAVRSAEFTVINVCGTLGERISGGTGPCQVGDTGPGGGIIFYISPTIFNSPGSTCATACRYLEAAPDGWAPSDLENATYASNLGVRSNLMTDPFLVWSDSNFSAHTTMSTGTAIGTGKQNTSELATTVNSASRIYAFNAALSYAGAGTATTVGEWFLPSVDELNELCKFARGIATGVTSVQCSSAGTLKPGFTSDNSRYWSSTQDLANPGQTLLRDLASATTGQYYSTYGNSFRPIRAFAGTPTTIGIAQILGVTPPVTGATPVTTITSSDQYTGTISWSTTPSTFGASTAYTATITLTPKTGYTLTGVGTNFFAVASGTATNPSSNGVITALFAATAPASATTFISGGNFTIEMWVKPENGFNLAARHELLALSPSNVSSRFDIWFENGVWTLYTDEGGAGHATDFAGTGSAPVIGEWHNIVVTRTAGVLHVFFDGVDQATYANNGDFSSYHSLLLGMDPGPGAGSGNALVANLRIVDGTAVYQSNFVPSAVAPTRISGTTFLLQDYMSGVSGYVAGENTLIEGSGGLRATATSYYEFTFGDNALTVKSHDAAAPVGNYTSSEMPPYLVGSRGPGGGTIFYAAPTTFSAPGTACDPSCKYLEVAPIDWSNPGIATDDPVYPWAISPNLTTTVPSFNGYDASGVDIGTGLTNTNAIVAQNGSCTPVASDVSACSTAAAAARAYRGGALDDWFLPSKLENHLMLTDRVVYQLRPNGYWDSSEHGPDTPWYEGFEGSGMDWDVTKGYASSYARPIRAFGI